jgi:sarcosine oxidase subunit gamma
MAEMTLSQRPLWGDIAPPGRSGCLSGPPGLIVTPFEGQSILQCAVARRRAAASGPDPWAITYLGADWPAVGTTRSVNGRLLLWNGPGKCWVLSAPSRLPDPRAIAAFDGLVCDQSHGWGLLRLSGPARHAVLAKGCMLDLDPAIFGDGATAMTSIAHGNLQLWRDGETFNLAMPRSLAGSLWHWLAASAAEFGLEVRPPERPA